jgi:hypothetical protein
MPKTNGSGRNQRNNPYQLDELFIKFHRTPAGIALRWRTELLVMSSLAATWWRLDTWTSLMWAGVILGRLAAIVAAVPHPVGSSPGGSGACWPGTGCKGCATKPGCTPAPGGSRSSCTPAAPRRPTVRTTAMDSGHSGGQRNAKPQVTATCSAATGNREPNRGNLWCLVSNLS